MYSKAEASKIREHFWTKFGQYMQPVPFSGGAKLNWVNYKTGVKGIRFTMQAEPKFASVEIQIAHPDQEIRILAMKQLVHVIPELELLSGYSWEVDDKAFFDGKRIVLIHSRIGDISVFRETDWPVFVQFFKSSVIAFDQIWTEQKDIIEMIFNG